MERKFKRSIALVLLLVLVLCQVDLVGAGGVSITATGAIVMDYDTGEVLYGKNQDMWLVPASMTKILTTYIIYQEMEAGNLSKDSLLAVSPEVARLSKDRSYPMAVPLYDNEYTVDQFIKLIMIPSASASCIAVAENISGSEEEFVKRMNRLAGEIRMEANFKNSHGARPHYTTPRSIAILVKRFIDDYPDILNYTSMQAIEFNGRKYNILNKLMHSRRYEGCDGFKTGTIPSAGYCLAATAKRNGRRAIVVVFKSTSDANRFTDASKLLDLAFEKIEAKDRSRKDTKLEFINMPEEVRLNTEYRPAVKFSNMGETYSHNGKFYLNGVLLDEIKSTELRNNMEIDLSFTLEDRTSDSLELTYEIEQVDGSKKLLSQEIRLSQKPAALYRDIDSSPVEEQVEYLTSNNILRGLNNGYFGLDQGATRADFITSLGRMVEHLKIDSMENNQANYKDVSQADYFNKYVNWANSKGLIKGYNGQFMPNKEISLEEAALIIYKLKTAYRLDFKESNISPVANSSNIWAREALEDLARTSILDRPDGKTIEPGAKLTRGYLASIIYRSLENINMD